MKVAALIPVFLFSFIFCFSQAQDSLGISHPPDSLTPKKMVAPWWVEKFRLTAGFFLPVNNTKVQVGVNGTANGSVIDFRKDLGFNTAIATFLAGFQWRISRRSRLNLSYFKMNHSATHTLQRDITFDSTTYYANTSVNSFFNTKIYQFSYGYAIIVKPNYEVGVSIGAHTVGASAGIAVNGVSVGLEQSNDFGFTAPLPDLGIWGGYAISKRFAVNMEFSYLALTVNNITGKLLTYNLVFTYQILPQLDLSAAYTGLNFTVNTTKKNLAGEFRWGYNGPTLCASFTFGKKSWTH